MSCRKPVRATRRKESVNSEAELAPHSAEVISNTKLKNVITEVEWATAPGHSGSAKLNENSIKRLRRPLSPKLFTARGISVRQSARLAEKVAKRKAFLYKALLDFFVSKSNSAFCTKLMDYVKEQPMLKQVKVPGNMNQQIESTCRTKEVCLEIIRWISKLQRCGWSLAGNLSAEDIYVSPMGHIKVPKSKRKLLKRANNKRNRNDMSTIGQILQNDVLSGHKDLPVGLQHLLDLLDNFTEKNRMLIENHIELKKPSEALSLFSRMYIQLELLELSDRSKYETLISKLPYCGENDNWRQRAFGNMYLLRTLTYKSQLTRGRFTVANLQDRKIGIYGKEGRSMLKLMRNCTEHLPLACSLTRVKKGTPWVENFKFRHIKRMFIDAFPVVFFVFQQLIHEAKKLCASLT